MNVDIMECPHCRTQVAPRPDGTCPACHQQISGVPHPALVPVSLFSATPAPAEISPAQHLGEFYRTLLTLTPRLIATPAIQAGNVLVFLAMVASGVNFFSPSGQSVLDWGANFGPRTMNGEWWRLVTNCFLHFGIIHLALNMWVLQSIGPLVERLVGNFGFVVLYLISGIAGSIASLAWNPLVISAGASGAVFGCAGALLGLIAFRWDSVPLPVLKELRSSIGVFLLYNFVFGVAIPGIDLAAHLGGLVGGFFCGLILSQPLSLLMLARRPLRNIVLLGTGTVALTLAAIALPPASADIQGELQRFGELEKQVIEINNSLAQRSQQGTISDEDYANSIDEQILPPWIEIRRRLEEQLHSLKSNQAQLTRLVEYMRQREQSWQLQVEGLREHDSAKLEKAGQLHQTANKLAKQLADPAPAP